MDLLNDVPAWLSAVIALGALLVSILSAVMTWYYASEGRKAAWTSAEASKHSANSAERSAVSAEQSLIEQRRANDFVEREAAKEVTHWQIEPTSANGMFELKELGQSTKYDVEIFVNGSKIHVKERFDIGASEIFPAFLTASGGECVVKWADEPKGELNKPWVTQLHRPSRKR